MTTYRSDDDFPLEMDGLDPLARARDRFHIPRTADGKEVIYLCGNSLGLQPRAVENAVRQELEDWKNLGVEAHFHAKHPWMSYHELLTQQLANLVGARPNEVVAMNGLTVNLHLMMVSFYRPTPTRHKILIEAHAFPSDRYAVASQIRYHGLDPARSLIEWRPRPGETLLHTEDIESLIEREGDSIALILIGGVNYYTGQLYEMERVTRAGRSKGCVVGWDLAHAAGNVSLKLHDWDVDFACWCSYKYLNAGPGSVAGCFVHERHADNPDLPRFCGWWGNNKASRFKMGPDFDAISGAEGWQLSNPPILSLAAVKTALDIFDELGMNALREKSLLLTGYLEFLLDSLHTDAFTILTPRDPNQRGCQLSIVVKENGRKVFDAISRNGIVCDWREPNCIRVAPVPLYNRFADIHDFATIFAAQIGGRELQAARVDSSEPRP
jgi:kynureninase